MTSNLSRPTRGGPGKIPEILPAASPGGPEIGAQILNFFGKMDPSGSPVAADRSVSKS